MGPILGPFWADFVAYFGAICHLRVGAVGVEGRRRTGVQVSRLLPAADGVEALAARAARAMLTALGAAPPSGAAAAGQCWR